MRTRALVIAALFALPSLATAQVGRIPRTGRGGTAPQPAPLPPEIGPVARDLSLKRSRWSGEAYSMISSIELPSTLGTSTRYTTVGAGSRASYRINDSFSATLDLTSTIPGLTTTSQTIEAGTRYSPLAWTHVLRPFVDVRAGYLRLANDFAVPSGASGVGGSFEDYVEGSRYSRGFGGVAGTGVEYSLTSSVAITTELSAMRNRMTTYRIVSAGDIPRGTSYSMTSYRLALGVRLNPARALHLDQNPTK